MNWKRIPKENSSQPSTGTYKDWKELLSVEGFHQCVYCSISEAEFGGIRNFHVEHYKPKSLPAFASLVNTYTNLFFACAICNSFKSNDWLGEPTKELNTPCYPDPSVVDYSELFCVNDVGILVGNNLAAKYLIQKIYLNRPQLIINRREHLFEEKYLRIKSKLRAQFLVLCEKIESGNDVEKAVGYLREVQNRISDLETLYHRRNNILPYWECQVHR